LRTNLSSASRAPNPSELFSDGLHHSLARIELGELRIDSEQSFKIGADLQGSLYGVRFNIQPYYNLINDFIILEPSGTDTTIRGAFPVWQYRQSDSTLYGINATLSYNYSNFGLTSNLAYVNGQDLEREEALINMPPLNVSNTLTYRKAEWNNFFLSLNSQFVTEQTRFPDNNFDVRIINRTTGEFEDVLLDISTPPKAYHLLNLKSGMQFDWGEKQLSVNLLVNNVLNTSYRSYLNALRFYADEVGTNAMLQLKLNY
jgi:iron complex outermembrane receptor protein